MNNRLSFFKFYFSFILVFFILDLDKGHDVIVTQVTKHDKGVIHITVTCHMEKDIKSSEINDIVQYNNSMLAL